MIYYTDCVWFWNIILSLVNYLILSYLVLKLLYTKVIALQQNRLAWNIADTNMSLTALKDM